MKKKVELILVILVLSYRAFGQTEENTIAQVYKGHSYELIKEKLTWKEASLQAKKLGGYLVEIESKEENDVVFNLLSQINSDEIDELRVLDGANSSYVWLGAEDFNEDGGEGNFRWNGDLQKKSGGDFWKGGMRGNAIENAYTNWGRNNPGSGGLDERGANIQDAVGMAVNHWPLNAPPSWTMGKAGQWNDISEENELYYVVEYNYVLPKLLDLENRKGADVYPVPFNEEITVVGGDRSLSQVKIVSLTGQVLEEIASNGEEEQVIETSELKLGLYLICLTFENGESYSQRILKE